MKKMLFSEARMIRFAMAKGPEGVPFIPEALKREPDTLAKLDKHLETLDKYEKLVEEWGKTENVHPLAKTETALLLEAKRKDIKTYREALLKTKIRLETEKQKEEIQTTIALVKKVVGEDSELGAEVLKVEKTVDSMGEIGDDWEPKKYEEFRKNLSAQDQELKKIIQEYSKSIVQYERNESTYEYLDSRKKVERDPKLKESYAQINKAFSALEALGAPDKTKNKLASQQKYRDEITKVQDDLSNALGIKTKELAERKALESKIAAINTRIKIQKTRINISKDILENEENAPVNMVSRFEKTKSEALKSLDEIKLDVDTSTIADCDTAAKKADEIFANFEKAYEADKALYAAAKEKLEKDTAAYDKTIAKYNELEAMISTEGLKTFKLIGKSGEERALMAKYSDILKKIGTPSAPDLRTGSGYAESCEVRIAKMTTDVENPLKIEMSIANLNKNNAKNVAKLYENYLKTGKVPTEKEIADAKQKDVDANWDMPGDIHQKTKDAVDETVATLQGVVLVQNTLKELTKKYDKQIQFVKAFMSNKQEGIQEYAEETAPKDTEFEEMQKEMAKTEKDLDKVLAEASMGIPEIPKVEISYKEQKEMADNMNKKFQEIEKAERLAAAKARKETQRIAAAKAKKRAERIAKKEKEEAEKLSIGVTGVPVPMDDKRITEDLD